MSGEQKVLQGTADIAANGRVDRNARGWMPIETVPKTGAAVLVYLEDELHHSRVHAATFHPNITVIGNMFAFDCPKATHWMPLPEAPNAKVRGEE